MYPSTQVCLILGSILSVYLSTHLCRMQRPRAWFSARKAWISYHSDPDKSPRDNRYMLLYSCLYFTFTTRKYQVITFLLFNAIQFDQSIEQWPYLNILWVGVGYSNLRKRSVQCTHTSLLRSFCSAWNFVLERIITKSSKILDIVFVVFPLQ